MFKVVELNEMYIVSGIYKDYIIIFTSNINNSTIDIVNFMKLIETSYL